jgi:hypothetical protein
MLERATGLDANGNKVDNHRAPRCSPCDDLPPDNPPHRRILSTSQSPTPESSKNFVKLTYVPHRCRRIKCSPASNSHRTLHQTGRDSDTIAHKQLSEKASAFGSIDDVDLLDKCNVSTNATAAGLWRAILYICNEEHQIAVF